MKKKYPLANKIVPIAVVLAFIVVVLGAYTRLTHAGLGCPDWPGCYGHMVLPSHPQGLSKAQSAYPDLPIEQGKAWTEMIHRYLAGSLGLLIFFIAVTAIGQRVKKQHFPLVLPLILMGLLFFQAALGMWTVTLKLLPVVVMGHLLGGLSIFACLWALFLSLNPKHKTFDENQACQFLRPWVLFGLVIVVVQIALGGWVSSNYAGLSCVGFPSCNGQWLPSLNLREGFNLFTPLGINYQGGWLTSSARISIQMVHRFGAIITASYVLVLSGLVLSRSRALTIYPIAMTAIAIVLLQFSLGVMNVLWQLPLSLAVAHNAVAALLLGTMVTMLYRVYSRRVI